MNMELGLGNTLLAGDPRLVDHIVGEVKSQGIFDQFRKECIADVDTKPAYQNLRTRVESSVNSFLSKQTWKADLNKNQLRETLRKHIHEAPYLDAGVERIVDQVVNPKVYSVFMPQIEDVVYKFLGLERPKNRRRNGPCSGFKDLLPIDLDPVSPESDKNSLRDVSLDSVDAHMDEPDSRSKEVSVSSTEQNRKDDEIEKNPSRNGHHANDEGASQDFPSKPSSVQPPTSANLNNTAKSEERVDEEEEDSPMFEPIDIMNLNDSQISNDSHLSGISELTSHRSRSPDFSNDGSRDNMDFSNHDSEFSKVSSNSRLSIVTDFGSSNHDSTPLSSEPHRDERDKNDSKYVKDNFKAVREFESVKGGNRDAKTIYESSTSKETTPSDTKTIRRSLSSKETSRDGMEVASKESRDFRDKIKDFEPSRSKSTKDRHEASKDSKKDREKEISKKQPSNHADPKTDKSSKPKSKEKTEVSRSSLEKAREKDSSIKPKEEKLKEMERKESSGAGKEVKDLKDIYKEKIRELREKKELLREKKKDWEKIGKDNNKDTKLLKETKEKRDSSREKKDTRDHKSATSKNSSRADGKALKLSEKEVKVAKSDSKEKGKRDERRYSKEHKSKTITGQPDDKIDVKRLSRSDKEDKIEKSETKQKSLVKKESRGDSTGKNSDGKRDSKGELESKDKKRRDEKKGKTKDDHSSMRKNSDDRRSTDRDGSNGSNGKNSQKSSSSSGASSGKPVSSSLSKESSNTSSNSSSETSDSIEETQQNDKLRISMDEKQSQDTREIDSYCDADSQAKRLDLGQSEISLPIKKRPLPGEDNNAKGEILMKKPKFAKNFQEAKKLMKIRRKIEKEKIRQQMEMEQLEKNIESRSNSPAEVAPKIVQNDIQSVPDDERVQIIEVQDEEYDEPYPEIQSDFTLEERSQIILGGESIFTSDLPTRELLNAKSTLSEMELSIRQSLTEMITDKKIDDETCLVPKNSQSLVEPETELSKKESSVDGREESLSSEFDKAETLRIVAEASTSKDSSEMDKPEVPKSSASPEQVVKNETNIIDNECCEQEEKDEETVCKSETVENSEEIGIVGLSKNEDTDSQEKLKHEFVEEQEKVEASKCEEKSCLEIVKKQEKVEASKDEKKSTPEIVKKQEKIEGSKSEEKSTPAEIIKKQEKIEGSTSEERSTPEIIKKQENIEESKSEEKSTPEIVNETKQIEAPKSEEKSTSEIIKHQENIKALKSEEKSEEIVEDITKKIEPSISDTPKVGSLVDSYLSRENVTKSCKKDEKFSPTDATSKMDEDMACQSDDEPCLYFTVDNERLDRFTKFMKSLEIDECSSVNRVEEETAEAASSDEIVSSVSKAMAPPKPKRKYSTSPLTDILLNNANNNNNADKITAPSIADDVDESNSNIIKKRKIGRPRKQKSNPSLCSQQNLLNGENFVMPLSPESDVSATSEKTSSNSIKDDKSRPRGSNQRYTSDDLYKPRPLFASSSRRSRRSNQA